METALTHLVSVAYVFQREASTSSELQKGVQVEHFLYAGKYLG